MSVGNVLFSPHARRAALFPRPGILSLGTGDNNLHVFTTILAHILPQAAGFMSAVKRRSTVHDLASLRLHPDGTRVANSEQNNRPRHAKYVVKDSRGNWIARDAGGLGQVKQRRAARPEQGAADGGQVGGNDEEVGDEVGRSSSKAKGKQRAREEDGEVDEDVPRDSRAKRRKHFQEDFNFCDPAHPEELLLPPFQPAVPFPTSVSLLFVLLR